MLVITVVTLLLGALLRRSHEGSVLPPGCSVHGVCEVRFRGIYVDQPFEVELHGTFTLNDSLACRPVKTSCSYTVRGFFDGGDGEFAIRFSPPRAGNWLYRSSCQRAELRREGLVRVDSGVDRQRGPAKAEWPRQFRFANGDEYFPVGTTAYAWAHQSPRMRAATLLTLQQGMGRAFNKMRFTILPKWYSYNHEEPPSNLYPYEGTPPANWNFRAFNPRFWRHFESVLSELNQLGVRNAHHRRIVESCRV